MRLFQKMFIPRFFFQITTGKLGIDLERTLVIHDEKNPNIWKTEVELILIWTISWRYYWIAEVALQMSSEHYQAAEKQNRKMKNNHIYYPDNIFEFIYHSNFDHNFHPLVFQCCLSWHLRLCQGGPRRHRGSSKVCSSRTRKPEEKRPLCSRFAHLRFVYHWSPWTWSWLLNKMITKSNINFFATHYRRILSRSQLIILIIIPADNVKLRPGRKVGEVRGTRRPSVSEQRAPSAETQKNLRLDCWKREF